MLRYKKLWLCVTVLILIDGGMTAWAVSGGHAEERNTQVLDLIELHGLTVAILISVSIRVTLVGVVAWIQYVSPYESFKLIPISILLPIAAAPVVWNLYVLA